MSDTRFIILGIGLVFAGIIVLTIFGSQFFESTIESEQFENCFEYSEDKPPKPVECSDIVQGKILMFGVVIGLTIAGVLTLIKGAKGNWDQNVKPEDIVGPGSENHTDSDKSDAG